MTTASYAYENVGIPAAPTGGTVFYAYENIGLLSPTPPRLNYCGWGIPIALPGFDWPIHPTAFYAYEDVLT